MGAELSWVELGRIVWLLPWWPILFLKEYDRLEQKSGIRDHIFVLRSYFRISTKRLSIVNTKEIHSRKYAVYYADTESWNALVILLNFILMHVYTKILSTICLFKRLGSLTNNFCPANFDKIILQRASKCFNYYKI